MWIEGRRRGGAKDLSNHLQKAENESVAIRQLEGFTLKGLTGANLTKALKQMEAIGYGKGCKRNFYHAIVAPSYGETLTAAQRDFMVDYYAEHMGFRGHQRTVVEHWKHGKQHFHLVFNIIHPVTGKIHELKWTKQKEWRISRGLEEILGLSSPHVRGKSTPTWAIQRGKRTGIDPRKMRKEVTTLFHTSKTAQEFVSALDKAGYALTHGKRNQLVLVDRFGDTHGLMRRIQGKKLADLRRKFPGIENVQFPSHAMLVRERKVETVQETAHQRETINIQRIREDVQKAYRTSKSGAEFFARLNKRGYALGRMLTNFAVIDTNGDVHGLDKLLGNAITRRLGEKFPDIYAILPRPIPEIIRRLKANASGSGNLAYARRQRAQGPECSVPAHNMSETAAIGLIKGKRLETARTEHSTAPIKPSTKGWPEAAIIDWETWGHEDPARFFAKWPECVAPGFMLRGFFF
jgi:hypothetical protein